MLNENLVDAYLNALELQRRNFDLKFLNEIVRRHVATFAFSSVACRLKNEQPLDLESLFQRIVVKRRGGYCFEQNALLHGVLEQLGASPELYLARVIYNQDINPGLTHRITIIRHNGQAFIVDVGFGPIGPRVPIPLSDDETRDGAKSYRAIEKKPGEYHLQVLKDGEFFSLYRFELACYGEADCEVGHFYSHRHPDATFVNNLVVSLLMDNETRSLRNSEYHVLSETGSHKLLVNSSDQLIQILVDELGIKITEAEGRLLFAGLAPR